MKTLDELDRRIIKELSHDARRSLRKMSRRLGISITTLSTRISAMEKSGLLKGYAAIVDPEMVGYDLTAVIEIVVSKGKLLEVEKEIAAMQNVFAVYDITGSTDALILARFRKRSEMSAFIKSLLAMRYVERTNTHVALNVMKEDFRIEV
jgi:DNA-binding Lrp family transcriptional regulator